MKNVGIQSKKSQKRGQAIAEYLILTALIAVASIGIIQVISKNLRGKLDQVNSAIADGKKRAFKGETDTKNQTQMIDMGDFNQTIKDTK